MVDIVIRASRPDDRAMLASLFLRVGEGSPLPTLWGHAPSEADIYLFPYLDHESGSLLIAELDGRPVGYLAGCVDSAAFPSEDLRFERAVRSHRLFTRPRALAFFARAGWDTLGAKLRRIPTAGELHDDRWPSHLHINVEPSARGTGAAQALMDSWLERLAAAGSPGCYLQTLRENQRATAFFVHQGFVAYGGAVLVPGVRYLHRQVHQVTMVRPAPGTPTAAD